jgi:hypothetical protein
MRSNKRQPSFVGYLSNYIITVKCVLTVTCLLLPSVLCHLSYAATLFQVICSYLKKKICLKHVIFVQCTRISFLFCYCVLGDNFFQSVDEREKNLNHYASTADLLIGFYPVKFWFMAFKMVLRNHARRSRDQRTRAVRESARTRRQTYFSYFGRLIKRKKWLLWL